MNARRSTCKAVGCSAIAFNNLFCMAHWRAVPADLQRRIHAALGQWASSQQQNRIAHHAMYQALVAEAVAEVEKFEHQPEEKSDELPANAQS